MTARDRRARDEAGQTTIEYVLLLAIVVGLFSIVANGLRKSGVNQMMMRPLKEDFARVYQYGHPKARGYDDGGPTHHPRAEGGGDNNFRIFISPR